jgi:hypothetical protein
MAYHVLAAADYLLHAAHAVLYADTDNYITEKLRAGISHLDSAQHEHLST